MFDLYCIYTVSFLTNIQHIWPLFDLHCTLHWSSSSVSLVTVSDNSLLLSLTCSISWRIGSKAACVSPGNCWDVFWELDKGLLWISKFEPDKILELSSSDGYLKLKVTSKVKVHFYNCTFFSLICLVDACMHINYLKN